MEVKVILEENKTNFENQLKELLENGYKIQASNFTRQINNIKTERERLKTIADLKKEYIVYDITFYALLIKE